MMRVSENIMSDTTTNYQGSTLSFIEVNKWDMIQRPKLCRTFIFKNGDFSSI